RVPLRQRRDHRGRMLVPLLRYFFKTLGSEPDRASEAPALIGELFRIERTITTASRAAPGGCPPGAVAPSSSASFGAGADGRDLPETPLAAALTSAGNPRRALAFFLEDGRMPLHNNRSKLELRRQVVGRKQWFFGADEAARVNDFRVPARELRRPPH